MNDNRIQLTWSDAWHHHDPHDDLNIYDRAGVAWKRDQGGSAWRKALTRWMPNGGRQQWTPEDDEPVWIDAPPIPEPPDGARIEFEHNTDVYAAWRDDASSVKAGWAADHGWCLFGSSVPRTWAIMWLEFGESLRTMVRLTPNPEDVANYAKWPTALMAAEATR